MSVYDLNDLQMKYDTLANEYQICRCKLDSKCEALLILSKELDQCRSERDQFKLMAEQLRERYQAIKRQISGRSPRGSSHNLLETHMYKDMETESLVQLLCDTKEIKKSLQFETDDLKQKLSDAQGDIKLLREQIARQRVGTGDEGITTRHFPAYEREDLVKQLEASREQYLQLEHDLQQLLDEKEDQETELDAYKRKYENLNRELNYILKGDEKRIVDIDALVMENKYLNERLKQMEEEKSMAMATASKYKSILERKKNKGILKFGQSRSGGLVITQKQVGQMLHQPNNLPSTPQAMADLQGLCGALLDTINDKNLALSHQRKTNKILGNRISELEKKLKTLEVSGLWNIPDVSCLEKLRSECEEVKTLIPRHFSESSDGTTHTTEKLDDLHDYDSELSSSGPSCVTSPVHVAQSVRFSANTMCTDDLDLLPTKETLPETNNKEDVPTNTNGVSSDQQSVKEDEKEEDESDSDQLLAGFIIGKTGRKHKTRKDNSRGKYTKIEAKSLLDNQSQSESESSPEKQRYTDIGDYDDEMTDKISLLLGDATSKLQNRSKNEQDNCNHNSPGQCTAKTSLTKKSIPRSSLVMNIDCKFESDREKEAVIDSDAYKTGHKSSFVENLIDMNSPVHESGMLPSETRTSPLPMSQVPLSPQGSVDGPDGINVLQTESQISNSPNIAPKTLNSTESSNSGTSAQPQQSGSKVSLSSQFFGESISEATCAHPTKSSVASSDNKEQHTSISTSQELIPDIQIHDESAETSSLLTTNHVQYSEDATKSADPSLSAGSAPLPVQENSKNSLTEDSFVREGAIGEEIDGGRYVSESINDSKDLGVSDKECESSKKEAAACGAHPQGFDESSSKEPLLFDDRDDVTDSGLGSPHSFNMC